MDKIKEITWRGIYLFVGICIMFVWFNMTSPNIIKEQLNQIDGFGYLIGWAAFPLIAILYFVVPVITKKKKLFCEKDLK